MLILAFCGDARGRRAHPRDADDEGDGNSRQEHADGRDHGVKSDTGDERRDERHRDHSTESLTFHEPKRSNPRATFFGREFEHTPTFCAALVTASSPR